MQQPPKCPCAGRNKNRQINWSDRWDWNCFVHTSVFSKEVRKDMRKEGSESETLTMLRKTRICFSALLLINLMPSYLLQAALPHLLCSGLAKDDSAPWFHLWKCLPGLVYGSIISLRHQLRLAENERNVTAETQLECWWWREMLYKRLALLNPLCIPETNLIMNYFMGDTSWISFACWRVTLFSFFSPYFPGSFDKNSKGHY